MLMLMEEVARPLTAPWDEACIFNPTTAAATHKHQHTITTIYLTLSSKNRHFSYLYTNSILCVVHLFFAPLDFVIIN
jgi:hypothetical protein